MSLKKKDLLFELGIYALSVLLAGLLWHKQVTLIVCYGFISVIAILRWHTKSDLFFYFAAFLLGPIAESVAVYFGAWEYSKKFFLIPIWLPLLWGIGALIVKNMSETLLRK